MAKHPQDRVRLALEELHRAFPWGTYPEMRPNQEAAFKAIAEENGGSVILELPTGSGKSAVGYTFLARKSGSAEKPLFWVVPNKAQVEQVKSLHPDVQVAFGRSEHKCLYYDDQDLRAHEIPCLTLIDCPHRVNQETGETHTPGAQRCPYYQQKYEAKQFEGGIVVSTVAFYLFTKLFSREFEMPEALVIDEAHQLASIVRGALSYDITDYHLEQAVSLLEQIGAEEAQTLDNFRAKMLGIIAKKPPKEKCLLDAREIRSLMRELEEVDTKALRQKVGEAVRNGLIDPKEKREVLKKLEVITRDIPRYLHSLDYALDGKDHKALNYVFAYYEEERPEGKRVQYKLVIRSYYVAALIAKRLLSPETLAFSATIGDSEVFGFESGIKAPARSFGSDFPADNTRVYMPTDTPNLAMKARSRRDLPRSLRRIARACSKFAEEGIRSLVLVVSEDERHRILRMCSEEGVNAISYGGGYTAREAVTLFRGGVGEVLVGTLKQYGEGIDLPDGTAGVTFVLRPAYPPPSDPQAVFEERRFGNYRWRLWNYRVMLEALQARGRNVRSQTDRGVTIFVSQQFRRFVFGSLPKYLQESYRGNLTLDGCVDEAIELLG